MQRSLTLAAAGVILLAGCTTVTVGNGEVGSGTPRTEERAIGAVTEIRATASVVAHVTIGEPASLRVTADDNLLDNVTTRVTGGRLELGIQGSITSHSPITVTIVVPAIEAASATASARVELTNVHGDAVRLHADSSGSIKVAGEVADLDAVGSSAGRLELGDLSSTRASVRLDSAAQAWIRAAERISGDVSSAAVLTVLGDPGSVDVTTSSAGEIHRD